jgi:hypothetical protein
MKLLLDLHRAPPLWKLLIAGLPGSLLLMKLLLDRGWGYSFSLPILYGRPFNKFSDDSYEARSPGQFMSCNRPKPETFITIVCHI